jgi:hypothetical protein
MVRRLRKFVRLHRERLLSLVMLPVFFITSLPHSTCICGDGHREPFCTPGHCRACLSRASNTASGGHSCCKGHASEQGRSCCGIKHDEQTPAGDTSNTSIAAKHGCCCTGIVEVPAPAAVTNKSEFAGHGVLLAIAEPSSAFVSANELFPSVERINHSMPPPLDAVIVYLHLTI